MTFTVALVVAPYDYSNVARAVEAYNGLWFDVDHNPATGIQGKEHHEPWYLPTEDDPVPLWFSGFSVGPDGGAVRLRWGIVSDQPLDHLIVQRAPAEGGGAVTLATLPGDAREFTDLAPRAGEKYAYRVVAYGKFGSSFSTPTLTMTAPMLPTKLWLSYPNPFRDQTTISAHLAAQSNLDLAVFDVAGRRVAKLASGTRGAGEHIFTWNGTDEAGRRVPAGVYFCRLQVGDQLFREKLVVLR
ncbi:MAG TPA: FlgD immunoglobulin-like domain containing protein [Candidatus Krumholzibacteria bacterium]|nr:FlgD immunoglobulin-like domain containing protein [Candidatus Krumholzibacteria bacterium]